MSGPIKTCPYRVSPCNGPACMAWRFHPAGRLDASGADGFCGKLAAEYGQAANVRRLIDLWTVTAEVVDEGGVIRQAPVSALGEIVRLLQGEPAETVRGGSADEAERSLVGLALDRAEDVGRSAWCGRVTARHFRVEALGLLWEAARAAVAQGASLSRSRAYDEANAMGVPARDLWDAVAAIQRRSFVGVIEEAAAKARDPGGVMATGWDVGAGRWIDQAPDHAARQVLAAAHLRELQREALGKTNNRRQAAGGQGAEPPTGGGVTPPPQTPRAGAGRATEGAA